MGNFDLGQLQGLLPILIPMAILQLGLLIAALIHIFTHRSYKIGNRAFWVILVIAVNTVGPVLYFVLGQSDADYEEDEDK